MNSIIDRNRRAATSSAAKVIITGATAFGFILAPVMPGWAAITNSVSVTGTAPSGGSVTDTDSVDVTVEAPSPDLLIAKSFSFTTDTNSNSAGNPGDVVEYTFTVTNNGNVTMTGVGVTDTMDNGAALSVTFDSWSTQGTSPNATLGDATITLAPGSAAIFKASYTITQNDLDTGGGTAVDAVVDNNIDNSAVASGSYNTSSGSQSHTSPTPATAEVPLDVVEDIQVAKTADITSGAGAGDTITYTYTITNTGTVSISGISISDTINGDGTFTLASIDTATPTDNGTLGDTSNATNPTDGLWDILGPGDVLTLTATYVVTQNDVDNLQ